MELSDKEDNDKKREEKNMNITKGNSNNKHKILMDSFQDPETAESNIFKCSIGKRSLKCLQHKRRG